VIGDARSLQFAPGTRYSYSNGNFRILSDVLQERAGRSFAELLREQILAPAGMETAFLAADTRAMPDGAEGYEGTAETGFRLAENRVLWTGDAGLGASLDDLVAWERRIDATRDDQILVCCTELTSPEAIERYAAAAADVVASERAVAMAHA